MISSSSDKSRLNRVKEGVTHFLNTLKRLGRKFGNNETSKIEKKDIKHAFTQENSVLASLPADPFRQALVAGHIRNTREYVDPRMSRPAGIANQFQITNEQSSRPEGMVNEIESMSENLAASAADPFQKAPVADPLGKCSGPAEIANQFQSIDELSSSPEERSNFFLIEDSLRQAGIANHFQDINEQSSRPEGMVNEIESMSEHLAASAADPFQKAPVADPLGKCSGPADIANQFQSIDELSSSPEERSNFFLIEHSLRQAGIANHFQDIDELSSRPAGIDNPYQTTIELSPRQEGLVNKIEPMRQHLVRSPEPQFLNSEEQTEDVNIPSSTPDSLSSIHVTTDNKETFLSVGLEKSLNQLRLELTGSSSKLEMLGIVGMAGIGKTTLAKMIFQDPFIIQHFDLRAWVRISQSHSKTDLLLQVLKCINHQKNYDIHGNQSEASLEEELYRNLKGQRYLIVVDDLWSLETWTEMRRVYSNDSVRSRILFTSRQINVIKDLQCKKIHQMSLLDEQSSWDLLKKKVFGQNTCPPDLIDTGKQIANKCKGLPLAIVVVGGILLKISRNSERWKVIADSLSSLVLSSTNPCQQMFALSYKHLRPHLQSCFLYMGAFPGGGFEIDSQALTRLWIAEGFIIPMDSENLEQIANEYLKDLVDRSLVVASSKRSNGSVKTCRLHDLLLEFCIKQARGDKFLDVIKDFREAEGHGDIIEVPRNNLPVEKNNRSCRFSFHCNTFQDTPPKSQARAALFTVRSHEVPDILLYNLDFRLLVVLVMIPLRFDSFPEEQVSKLSRLKYLALTVSYELPSAVFRLLSLQTLIVNDSRIMSDTSAALALPVEFWGSMNLRHMELQVANYLPPPNDGSIVKQLVSLRTLSKVTLSSFFSVACFACVPNVTKLGVCETMEDFRADCSWDRFFKNVGSLRYLDTLKLYCLQMNNCTPRVLPISSPNVFPVKLRKLTLNRSNLPWEKMEILGKLANLEVLKLRNYAFQGPEWETQEGGFQRLRYLLIENTDLRHWSLECHDCFPRLEQLFLKFCQLLEVPEQIGDISTLSCIKLRYCSSSAEHSVKYIQEQQKAFSHNIEIHIQSKTRY